MNRKIFTLLASALMLFSTAFYANARRVAGYSVGDTVRTLEVGTQKGMYHIQVDEITLPFKKVPAGIICKFMGYDLMKVVAADPTVPSKVINAYNDYAASHISIDELLVAIPAKWFNYDPNTKEWTIGTTSTDTMVLAVTELGEVKVVSANDLVNSMASDNASLTDLQATMWCINVEQDVTQGYGEEPTYNFTNKVYGKDLDWNKVGITKLGTNTGWMYSKSYDNGSLNHTQPFHRLSENHFNDGKYTVVTIDTTAFAKNGELKLYTTNVDVDDFTADTIAGLIKTTIVEVCPLVLTAKDLNTRLYTSDAEGFTLNWGDVLAENPFDGNILYAEDSKNGDAKKYGYVNVRVGGKSGKYIVNKNKVDAPQYLNSDGTGTRYLQLFEESKLGTDKGKDSYNASYRFVYFPSRDSIVINAYEVWHHNNPGVGDDVQKWDNGSYDSDAPGAIHYWYGLYNDAIQDYLIVRKQDLNTVAGGTQKVATIGKHPSNVNISFIGINCNPVDLDAWQVPEGVYTIWDERGRCLGVRIYNGSYSPQWMELEEGECPDRIPAYQWVVEHSEESNSRVNITSREFGNLNPESKEIQVNMLNVLVKRTPTQIFNSSKYSSKFLYGPLTTTYTAAGSYEPIIYGEVAGRVIEPIKADECVVNVGKKNSGFRPVTNEYLNDPYIGYKHFFVDKDPTSPSFGKSEDSHVEAAGYGSTTECGMDYNAYAFNYLHEYAENDEYYISLEPKYNDTLMRVETNKTGFQFQLGTALREKDYVEEDYGYPYQKTFAAHKIVDSLTQVEYAQVKAPSLKRYYYEFQVADFYNYRDGLALQFAVLKGAKRDKADAENRLKYGVVDVWGEKDPLKYANIYLRETYFIKKDATPNEERKLQDPSRRTYYVLLDRIEREELDEVTAMGLEVSDTLKGGDGTAPFNLVQLAVDDKNMFIKAQGKTVSSARGFAFALENVNDPLYRRLRSIATDGAEAGTDEDPTKADAPKLLRFYRQRSNKGEFLYEDGLSQYAYSQSKAIDGIGFLGAGNIFEEENGKEQLMSDGQVKINYNLFVDTAYINRGTGWIKPQYLLAVGVSQNTKDTVIEVDQKFCSGSEVDSIRPYVIGRYLVNATDSARALKSDGSASYMRRAAATGDAKYDNYIWETSWDRLVWVPAIHVDDRLYIISQLEANGIDSSKYMVKDYNSDKWYVSATRLANAVDSATMERVPAESGMLGAYYDFEHWNNYHNDVCFSLRFVTRDAKNPLADGIDQLTGDTEDINYMKRFLIESETTNRTPFGNRKIAPTQGGWIRLMENQVAVMSRSSYEDAIQQAEVFNVELPNKWQAERGFPDQATSNETLAKVSVVAGQGSVTIYNAAGKTVTISNILGQTVAKATITGNSQTIAAPQGVVVVAVEGENTVKAVVK